MVFEGAAILDGTEAQGDLSTFFALSFDLADPYGMAGATLDLVDDSGLFLRGAASFVGFAEDQLLLTFSDLDGTAAALYGSTLSFELSFLDPVGAEPLAGLLDGPVYDLAGFGVGGEVLAPVPLPATGSLLLAALGAAAGLGLRRKEKASSWKPIQCGAERVGGA